MPDERIIVYVDGFNLYFGLKEAGYSNYKWLNIWNLCLSVLKPNQELVGIKYFTSRVSNNPTKQKRQTTYLEALETTGIELYYGQYQSADIECKRCGNIWRTFNEKMTDVNIATEMLIDAWEDRYDCAMLISGDSDLVPPAKAVHRYLQNKRVFVIFPPRRHNNSLAAVAKGFMTIGRKKLSDNKFPIEVPKTNGYILRKPVEW
jgi:uncharacterized LabA/DUF88 family protein